MSKKNIAVVSGGDSGEYGISVQSGEVVKKYLAGDQYNVYPILIKGTDWLYTCPHENTYEIDKNDFSLPMIAERIHFDFVFIAIHGTPGEDGKLQGYLDMMGIPYSTCDHVVSALTFNKHLCKLAVQSLGIKLAHSVFSTKNDHITASDILQKLKLPLFVKPNNGGSSVGMSKVNKAEELEAALNRAFEEDDEILVEEFIKGREITCGVLKHKGEIITLPVTEIISKKEFFDFEAKYDPKLAEEIVPAQIPENIFKHCQETSSQLYQQLNCKGIVRFDYIYNDDGMFFLEVNTVPGMTEASIVPKMARAHGLTLDQLFGMVVEEVMGN
ncbi:MAG TPA: D-alanine--D-alanine ligase [Bacteroidales bacterium]|nr:D-alanine--D-alanine ligase [Bacteroidales bacterium]HRX97583.1 D-alanine--D-alanine ligase [Bacteroidales bacterium]